MMHPYIAGELARVRLNTTGARHPASAPPET
jgi:hypothetical protein